MVITAANLFYYLHERGLASPEAVTSGEFRVFNMSRRNLAFHATSGKGGCVVKQVQRWRLANIALFEAEAHWYWLARHNPDFEPLSQFFCRCFGFDSENLILTLEFPAGSEGLNRFFRRLGTFPVETVRLLGETLGAFHYSLPDAAMERVRREFSRQLPFVLSWHDTDDAVFDAEPGALELVHIVKDHSVFAEAFARLRDAWERETPINGDMKFAHCILNGAGMYFVDWENGDFGDPCWDTGAIFQEFLSAWIGSIPAGPSETLHERAENSELSMPGIQDAVRAFWESYVKRAGLDEAAAARKLRRSVEYAAAWLIQVAYQNLRDASRITGRAISMVQLSLNIFEDPAGATRDLLGL